MKYQTEYCTSAEFCDEGSDMATKNGDQGKTNKMDKKRDFPVTKDEEMDSGSDSSSEESWDGDGDESDVEEGLVCEVFQRKALS